MLFLHFFVIKWSCLICLQKKALGNLVTLPKKMLPLQLQILKQILLVMSPKTALAPNSSSGSLMAPTTMAFVDDSSSGRFYLSPKICYFLGNSRPVAKQGVLKCSVFLFLLLEVCHIMASPYHQLLTNKLFRQDESNYNCTKASVNA